MKARKMTLGLRPSLAICAAALTAAALLASACSSSGSTNTGGTTPGATTASGGGSTPASTAKGSPIEVGLITSKTSSALAPYPQVFGAQNAAIAYINSTGGIKGHPLRANQCDDQDQANPAQACATAAVRSKDVAVVGGTEVFPSVFSTLGKAGLVFTGSTALIPEDLQSPISFPVTSAAVGWYYGMGALAVKLGAKKVTIVQCNIPACEGTAQYTVAALKAHGDTVKPQFVTFQIGQAITPSEAQQVIQQSPDAVVVSAPGPYPQQLMTLLRQANYKGKIINNIGSFDPAAIKAVGNSVADGTYVVSTTRPADETSNPAVQLFNKWMDKVSPSSAKDELSMMEWSAMLIFAKIARTLPSVTREAVLNAYKHLSTPINVGTVAPFAVAGHPSPLSSAPALHSTDVLFSKIENGKYKLMGGFTNPFKPTS